MLCPPLSSYAFEGWLHAAVADRGHAYKPTGPLRGKDLARTVDSAGEVDFATDDLRQLDVGPIPQGCSRRPRSEHLRSDATSGSAHIPGVNEAPCEGTSLLEDQYRLV